MDDTAQRDLIYPCDCGEDHFLRVSWWPGDIRRGFDMDAYFHIGGDFFPRMKKRVRVAWKVLRGGHADTYVGISLNAGTARELAATMTDVAVEWTRYLASAEAAKTE